MFGIPFGSSPINPLLWAPTGLKYLNIAIFNCGSAFAISLNISSIISLVLPYGLVVDNGESSVIGTIFASP